MTWSAPAATNSLERLNGEVKRRTDVVSIFPHEEAIYRLVGAILLDQNDEWSVERACALLRHARGRDLSDRHGFGYC